MEIKLRYEGVNLKQAINDMRAKARAKVVKPKATTVRRRFWTTQELKTVETMLRGGSHYGVVAARLGRSVSAVQVQARRQGFTKPASSRWTVEELQILERMWKAGEPASAITRALGGRTRLAVIGKAHRMGLPRRKNDYSAIDAHSKAA